MSGGPIDPARRDRRQAGHDRRRHVRDRRHFWPRFIPQGSLSRAVRWFTGPWTSANGLSWMRLLVLFIVVKWGLLTVYSIPTPSMSPTLKGVNDFFERDRVAVNKLAFGPRVPFTGRRIFVTGAPKRWDIVVFDSLAPSTEGDVLIKRVVGLPGESVRIEDGKILINGEPLVPPPDIAGALNYTTALGLSQHDLNRLILGFAKTQLIPFDLPREPERDYEQFGRDLNALAQQVQGRTLDNLTPPEVSRLTANVDPATYDLVRRWWQMKMSHFGSPRYGVSQNPEFGVVPEGHYYCLGDNGPESFDSRMFGWVPHANLIGRAFAIVTPPDRARDLSGFTGTPRGRLILYGSIALVLAWELVPGFIAVAPRLRGAIPALGLRRGDRVLVDRIAFGVRIPFSTRRFFWWHAPRVGDVICFRMSRRNALDMYIGEVRDVQRTPRMRILADGPSRTAARTPDLYTLDASDVLGLARFVIFPRRHRGRIRSRASRVESAPTDGID